MEKLQKDAPLLAAKLPYTPRSESLHVESWEEANALFTHRDDPSALVWCVFGIGMAYCLTIAQAWLEEDFEHTLVFIVDDPADYKQCPKRDTLLNNPQVRLFYLSPKQNLVAFAEYLAQLFILQTLSISCLPQRKNSRYLQLKKKLKHVSLSSNSAIIDCVNRPQNVVNNLIHNLSFIDGSIQLDSLKKALKGIPCIICGAGPSLKKALPILKTLQNKAFIIAGGSAANILEKAQIVPHLRAAIDPNLTEGRLVQYQNHFEVPFVYRSRVSHHALKCVHATKLFSRGASLLSLSTWMEDLLGIRGSIMKGGHSVTNFASRLALLFACDPIIYLGVDLSFSEGKKYADIVHLDGSDETAATPVNSLEWEQRTPYTDEKGEVHLSTWKWLAEAHWLSDFAIQHKTHAFYNASSDGIPISSIPYIDLHSLSKNHNRDLTAHLHHLLQHGKKISLSKQDIHSVVLSLHSSLVQCKELLEEQTERLVAIGQERMWIGTENTLTDLLLFEEPAYRHILQVYDKLQHTLYSRRCQSKGIWNVTPQWEIDIHRLNYLSLITDHLLEEPSLWPIKKI